MNAPGKDQIDRIVREALAEDGAGQDATVAFLEQQDAPVRAQVVSRESAVLAGLEVARAAFEAPGTDVRFETDRRDGEHVGPGDVVFEVSGPAGRVLAAERVALNFLQRLSGTATMAAQLSERVRHAGITILDTRKTTPLWRDLQKYAVRCGGAQNHRRDLTAMVLIKENHIRALGGEDALVRFLEERRGKKRPFVEVEVDSLAFLRRLLGGPIDRVMLDNFAPEQVREAVAAVTAFRNEHADYEIEIEVSGGIDAGNIDDYAIEGVDFISVGALTHSAPAVNLSLEVR